MLERTIKALYGLSGNLCAFPGCSALMIIENSIVTGAIAHIEGRRPNSPRYNPNMTDEQRDSVQNLVLLCPNHHSLVDKDPEKYNTEFLGQMKAGHERKHQGQHYDLPVDLLRIVSISVNNDEYSVEGVHNLLKVYQQLKGAETRRLWHDYFTHALEGLRISSPMYDDEKGVATPL